MANNNRTPDPAAVANIEKCAEVLVEILDNHGPVDILAAARALRDRSNDFAESGWKRARYGELATLLKRCL